MTCTVCLNCGHDLTPFRSIKMGALNIADQTAIHWKGVKVTLTMQQRLIVLAIARACGAVISLMAVADAADADDGHNPGGIVTVQLSRIRQAFQAIDPAFNGIETVRSMGFRWRIEDG